MVQTIIVLVINIIQLYVDHSVSLSTIMVYMYTSTGFSPEILRGAKSLDVYADTSSLQPSGDYSNGLVNCGYYEISGYRHALSIDHEVARCAVHHS